MKIKSLLSAVIAGLMVTVACQKTPVQPTPSEKLTVKLSASLYQFTKATDTAFEEGDQISVNIFNPECYLYNAHFTYTGGQLTSATPYEWYEDTEVEATITAMYPSSETMEGFAATQSFMVNADQSTKAGYAASDLLLAQTTAKPTAEAVNLPFKHALSKIVVNVDNQLKEDVADVWFTDVLGEVTFSTSDHSDLAATGSEGTVKAYKSGENSWQLIVAPQTASPKLALTTASGKQYTFVLSEDVTFSAGKVSTATVTVSPEGNYTAFTPEISDWVTDNELNFSQEEVATQEYSRWLGKWQVTNSEGVNLFVIDILHSENNKWYYMSGWESNNIFGFDTTMPEFMPELYFDKETGELCFISQYLNTMEDNSGYYDFYFSGTFTYDSKTFVLGSEVLNYRMADAEFLDSTYKTAAIEARDFVNQGITSPIEQICIMYSHSSSLSAIHVSLPTLPLTMTKIQ